MDNKAGRLICEGLFTTITSAAWNNDKIISRIRHALKVHDEVKANVGGYIPGHLPDCAVWAVEDQAGIMAKALSDALRITATEDADARSLKEMLTTGCKGIAAYADHAAILGYEKGQIYSFLMEAMGDIRCIPRVLDAGQCNDSCSLAVIALKLKESFGVEDINDRPVSFDIACTSKRPWPCCWHCWP